MKKIKLIAAAAVFSAAGFFGVQAYNNATMTDQEKMIQANIEALAENASNNSLDNDCHYVNGYVQFSSSGGGAYDCCRVWRNGTPKGKCK